MGTRQKLKHHAESIYGRHRFAVLLCLLIALLIGTPLLDASSLLVQEFDLVMAALMLAIVISLCFERHERIYAMTFGIPSIVLAGVGHALTGTGGILIVAHLCEVMFLFGSALLIVKSLFTTAALSFDSIWGAICGFLFLGVGWAVIYIMIETHQPDSFRVDAAINPANEQSRLLLNVLTYFSFTTLTTVGFGDISPLTPLTRTLAWMEAIMGQFYLAVVVAGLVSMMPVVHSSRRAHAESEREDAR